MDEMSALHQNQTWELTLLHDGKRIVSCRWCTLLSIIQMVQLSVPRHD